MDEVTCVCGSEMTRVDGDLFKCKACCRVWEFSAGFFESRACYISFVYDGVTISDPLTVSPEEAMDMLLDIRHDYAIALASGNGEDALALRQKWALLLMDMALPENCHWEGGPKAYRRNIRYTVPEAGQ